MLSVDTSIVSEVVLLQLVAVTIDEFNTKSEQEMICEYFVVPLRACWLS